MAITDTVIQFRLKKEEKERIGKGADLTGVTMSQFVRRAALTEAQYVLSDRTQFPLDDHRYDAFMDALDKYPEPNDALGKLLHTVAPWN